MNTPQIELTPGAIAVGVAAVAVGLYVLSKRQPGQSVAGAAGSAAVGAVVDAGAGVVTGIGDVVGVPRTDTTQCDIDLANGDYWAASFSCPAGRFLKAVTGQDTTPPPNTGGATGSW